MATLDSPVIHVVGTSFLTVYLTPSFNGEGLEGKIRFEKYPYSSICLTDYYFSFLHFLTSSVRLEFRVKKQEHGISALAYPG